MLTNVWNQYANRFLISRIVVQLPREEFLVAGHVKLLNRESLQNWKELRKNTCVCGCWKELESKKMDFLKTPVINNKALEHVTPSPVTFTKVSDCTIMSDAAAHLQRILVHQNILRETFRDDISRPLEPTKADAYQLTKELLRRNFMKFFYD